MKNNIEELKERLKMLYPNEDLTDEELDTIVSNLVQYFTIGAKMVYAVKKEQEKILGKQ